MKKQFLPQLVIPLTVLATAFVLLFFCNEKKNAAEYSYQRPGYWVKLFSFTGKTRPCGTGCVAWLSVKFTTQEDSVFWDSYNNLGDRYFLSVDSTDTHNFLSHYASKSAPGDSFCLLIKPGEFYRQQFRSDKIPFFSENDTVVKAFVNVRSFMTSEEFENFGQNFLNNEQEQIKKFYGNDVEAAAALTPEGFYLLDPPSPFFANAVSQDDEVTVSYTGYFLSGKVMDKSDTDFTFTYGSPGQVLDGLNIVIGRLNVGQTVKIILPSPLAFGDKGSSDKTVPPYTPLLYELTLKSINKYPTP